MDALRRSGGEGTWSSRTDHLFEVHDVMDAVQPAAWGVKVVLLGSAGVGKTTWITQLREGRFQVNTRATIGVDFFTRQYAVNGERYAVQFWDTAGMERQGTGSMTTAYLRGAHGVVVMLDITSRPSLQAAEEWCRVAQRATGSARAALLVLGNKQDRAPVERAVPADEGEALAQRYGGWYLETAARSRGSVKSCLRFLLDELVVTGRVGDPPDAPSARPLALAAGAGQAPTPGFTVAELQASQHRAANARGCGC
jgi:small GTP-binding protein